MPLPGRRLRDAICRMFHSDRTRPWRRNIAIGAAPSPDLPLSAVTVSLKQIAIGDLNEVGTAALQYAFPSFVSRDGYVPSSFSPDEYARQSDPAAEYYAPERRFAGCASLPRNRYYSVCIDPSGNDHGTLLNELYAYYVPHKAGRLMLREYEIGKDLTLGQLSDYSADYGPPPPRVIGLTFPRFQNGPHPFAKSMGVTEPVDYTPVLPLLVKMETIDKVIDLRDPTVADWFAREASSLHNQIGEVRLPVFPFLEPLNTFREILPEILVQELGGGLVTRVVGDWLRRVGVNALIFPSARNDCGVHIINGQMLDFVGWNLVDYRGAPPPGNLLFTSDRNHWFNRISAGPGTTAYEEGGSWIEIEDIAQYIAPDGETHGTWQVQGLVAWRQKQIKELLKGVLGDDKAPR